jgi:hypothetical protein
LLVLMSRIDPVVLPEKVMPDIRNEAAVAPVPETPTSKASPDGCTMVDDCPAPITLTFWSFHETAVDHAQVPAGMYTPSPPNIVGLTYPAVPGAESAMASCTSV